MATRTVFFHISTAGQIVFYLLALASIAICTHGFYVRWKSWQIGKPAASATDWLGRLRFLFDQAVLHRRVRRRRTAGWMHMGIAFGMAALFTGTCIVAVEHYGALALGDHWFYKGALYLVTKLALDLFGLGLAIGTAAALIRRYGLRPPGLGHQSIDGLFLVLLLLATVTGFALEGAGIAADPARHAFAGFSPVGMLFAKLLGIVAGTAYPVIWWVHMPFVLAVIALVPYGRWLHLFVAPLTILLQPDRPMGVLEGISMEEVEATGRIGIGSLSDLSKWQLMSLDGCMECGRCTDVCPANAAGSTLNPKNIVLDLRNLLRSASHEDVNLPLSTDVITDDALWACTNCHACVNECPSLIRHVDIIDGIRRFRVAEGRLSGDGAKMLRQLGSRENPWGLPNSQRMDWAKGTEVPLAKSDDEREVLLWVGCSGAFDPRGQKTVQAICGLMSLAGVNYSVLGPKERCSGDSARRMGDEFLFQQLAQTNIESLKNVHSKLIVTQCPHCLHTIKNEYPQLGGHFEVMHHTQFLNKLVTDGRLKIPKSVSESVVYHDPCFLARINGEIDAPRQLLGRVIKTELVEPVRSGKEAFCCGAGGGRMWMDDEPDKRPGLIRAKELLAAGANTIAVGCPFCKMMVGDSIAQLDNEHPKPVKDVAEVLWEAVKAEEGQ